VHRHLLWFPARRAKDEKFKYREGFSVEGSETRNLELAPAEPGGALTRLLKTEEISARGRNRYPVNGISFR
jgi:hypothetical protein